MAKQGEREAGQAMRYFGEAGGEGGRAGAVLEKVTKTFGQEQ